MEASALDGGFADTARDAARAFRSIMGAMARPGEILAVSGAMPPPDLSPAAGAVMLTLCDPDTPVYLAASCATSDVRAWMRFHTGAPEALPAEARFAFGTWEELRDLPFAAGEPEYPDRSATLVVACPTLETEGATLRGPGIQTVAKLSLPEIAAFQANHKMFPLGLDYIFTCGDRVAALPRSTEVS